MDPNRLAALDALIDIDQNGAYSNLALNKVIERKKPAFPGFVRELVYGVLENQIYIDYILGHFVRTPVAQMSKVTRNILRAGLYQLAFMNGVPAYAAVDESVKAARKLDRGRDKLVNAVLRRYLREKDRIKLPDRQKDLSAFLSIRYSYHQSIIALWMKELDNVQALEELLAAGNQKPPLSLRVNLLKTSVPVLITELEKEGFVCESGEGVPEALTVRPAEKSQKELTKTEPFLRGAFYIQDKSAMLPVCMMDPRPGELVIDVCAAPGGKTVFMAERMKNRGKIIAFDIHEHRLALIDETARRHGVSIIETKKHNSMMADESLIEKADCVLADVLCSGLGVIRRHPEIKYKDYEAECSGLPAQQGEILRAASRYVKPGGVLVYSTCTISEAENFGVVEEFLRENPSFTLPKDGVLQVFPHIHGGDGFCVFRMTKSNSQKKEMTG